MVGKDFLFREEALSSLHCASKACRLRWRNVGQRDRVEAVAKRPRTVLPGASLQNAQPGCPAGAEHFKAVALCQVGLSILQTPACLLSLQCVGQTRTRTGRTTHEVTPFAGYSSPIQRLPEVRLPARMRAAAAVGDCVRQAARQFAKSLTDPNACPRQRACSATTLHCRYAGGVGRTSFKEGRGILRLCDFLCEVLTQSNRSRALIFEDWQMPLQTPGRAVRCCSACTEKPSLALSQSPRVDLASILPTGRKRPQACELTLTHHSPAPCRG